MSQPASLHRDALLTVREVAARLRLSRPTVYHLLARGELAVVKFPGRERHRLRVRERDLEAFIAAHHHAGRPWAPEAEREVRRADRREAR